MSAETNEAEGGMLGAIDRREFLSSVALVAGGIAVSATVTWPSPAAAAAPQRAPLDDWTIDDMWGAYPRYADPIGYPHAPAGAVADVGSIDAILRVK